MATMTNPGRAVPAYVTATLLCRKLSKALFKHAMSAPAMKNAEDGSYEAWWCIRRQADGFVDDRSLDLGFEERRKFFAALDVAHRVRHFAAMRPITPAECDCDTARDVIALKRLMAFNGKVTF